MIRKILGYTQSHYTEVAQGAIFLEQVGNTEKNWADYEQLLKNVFSCFQGQKINLKFFQKYCSVRTKKLHKISFIYIFILFPYKFFLNWNRLNHGIWILLIRFGIYLFFHLRCEPSFQNDRSSNPCRPGHCIEVLLRSRNWSKEPQMTSFLSKLF